MPKNLRIEPSFIFNIRNWNSTKDKSMRKVRALRNLTDGKTGDSLPKGKEWEVSNKKAKELKDLKLVEYVKEVKEEKDTYSTKEEKSQYNTK